VIDAETIFQLGEHKLNNITASEANIGEKQSRQSDSKYNFVQYVFFEKGICSVRLYYENATHQLRNAIKTQK